MSIAQSARYASAVRSPLIGTTLASVIGLSGALVIAGALRLMGFLLFAFWKRELSSEVEKRVRDSRIRRPGRMGSAARVTSAGLGSGTTAVGPALFQEAAPAAVLDASPNLAMPSDL